MIGLTLLLTLSAFARTFAGVTVPDTVTVGGQTLVLNGMGLREKYFLDVYVGALYLPSASRDASAIIQLDAPKRVTMHFIYEEVPREKIIETLYEGLAKVPQYSGLKPQMDQVAGWMEDLHAGDEVLYDYVPGTGTVVTVKGKKKGTIPGADFMKLVFTIYLGPTPANEALKAGLLGAH